MKYLLLDCNNLAHRTWHVMKGNSKLLNDTAGMFGVLRDLVFLQEIHDCENVVFCFDSMTSLRKEFYPEYKANHERHPALDRQINALKTELLPGCGFKNVLCFAGYEADDVIGSICQNLRTKTECEMVIVSSDGDLLQLLGPKITIWNPMLKKTITYKTFAEKWNIDPPLWPLIKAVVGDNGDNIPGVYGVAEKTAIKILKGETVRPALQDAVDTAKLDGTTARNFKLVNLPWPGLKITRLEDETVWKTAWDEQMKKFNIRSLIGKYPLGAA